MPNIEITITMPGEVEVTSYYHCVCVFVCVCVCVFQSEIMSDDSESVSGNLRKLQISVHRSGSRRSSMYDKCSNMHVGSLFIYASTKGRVAILYASMDTCVRRIIDKQSPIKKT